MSQSAVLFLFITFQLPQEETCDWVKDCKYQTYHQHVEYDALLYEGQHQTLIRKFTNALK